MNPVRLKLTEVIIPSTVESGEKLYRHFGRGVRFSVDIGHPENRTSQYRYRAKKQRHLLQR